MVYFLSFLSDISLEKYLACGSSFLRFLAAFSRFRGKTFLRRIRLPAGAMHGLSANHEHLGSWPGWQLAQ